MDYQNINICFLFSIICLLIIIILYLNNINYCFSSCIILLCFSIGLYCCNIISYKKYNKTIIGSNEHNYEHNIKNLKNNLNNEINLLKTFNSKDDLIYNLSKLINGYVIEPFNKTKYNIATIKDHIHSELHKNKTIAQTMISIREKYNHNKPSVIYITDNDDLMNKINEKVQQIMEFDSKKKYDNIININNKITNITDKKIKQIKDDLENCITNKYNLEQENIESDKQYELVNTNLKIEQDKNKKLIVENEKLTIENTEKLNKLTEESEKLYDELDKCKNNENLELKDLHKTKQKLESQLKIHELTINNLENNSNNKEIMLTKTTNELTQKILDLSTDIENKELDNNKLIEEVNIFKKELLTLEAGKLVLENELEYITQNNSTNIDKINKLEEKIKQSKAIINNENVLLSEKEKKIELNNKLLEKLNIDIESKNLQIYELNNELTNYKTNLQNNKMLVEDITQKLNECNNKILDCSSTKKKLENNIDKYETELKIILDSITEMNNEIELHHNDIDSNKKTGSLELENIQKINAEINNVQDKLIKQKKIYQNLLSNKAECIQDIGKLNIELKQYKLKDGVSQKLIYNLNDKVLNNESKLTNIQMQLRDTETEIEQYDNNVKNLNIQIEKLQQLENQKNIIIENNNNNILEKKNIIKQLEQTLQNKKYEYEQKYNEYENIKKELTYKYETENNSLTNKLNSFAQNILNIVENGQTIKKQEENTKVELEKVKQSIIKLAINNENNIKKLKIQDNDINNKNKMIEELNKQMNNIITKLEIEKKINIDPEIIYVDKKELFNPIHKSKKKVTLKKTQKELEYINKMKDLNINI